jgi:molybdopterin converting factor small subunit
MKIHVKLFSVFRDCVPEADTRGELVLQMPDESTLWAVLERLELNKCLSGEVTLTDMMTAWQVTVNGVFETSWDRVLVDGDRLAVFPPMAGG